MTKVAIIIRVYNRIQDLENNLRIIRDTWTENDYYIIVVSNGYSHGYTISDDAAKLIDKLVVLEENAGHKKGNSQLLTEGVKYIPSGYDYTMILEADTWVYNDSTISKYIRLMEKDEKVVWSSADWYDKQYGLAVDIALIKTGYLLENPKLFDFDLFPECYISNYLRDTNAGYIRIKENMPVHIPSYVPKYPYVNNSKEKRFYVFPNARMVTHHIEYLKGGIEQKKYYFNVVSGQDYFSQHPVTARSWELFKMKFWTNMSRLFIKKSWFFKKIYKEAV